MRALEPVLRAPADPAIEARQGFVARDAAVDEIEDRLGDDPDRARIGDHVLDQAGRITCNPGARVAVHEVNNDESSQLLRKLLPFIDTASG